MATIYSTQLLVAVGATLDEFFEVPAGYIGIVRDADVYQGATISPNSLYMQGSLGQTIFKWDGGLGQDVNSGWRGRQVLNAGERVTMHIVGGFSWDYSISGYLLLAP